MEESAEPGAELSRGRGRAGAEWAGPRRPAEPLGGRGRRAGAGPRGEWAGPPRPAALLGGRGRGAGPAPTVRAKGRLERSSAARRAGPTAERSGAEWAWPSGDGAGPLRPRPAGGRCRGAGGVAGGACGRGRACSRDAGPGGGAGRGRPGVGSRSRAGGRAGEDGGRAGASSAGGRQARRAGGAGGRRGPVHQHRVHPRGEPPARTVGTDGRDPWPLARRARSSCVQNPRGWEGLDNCNGQTLCKRDPGIQILGAPSPPQFTLPPSFQVVSILLPKPLTPRPAF